MALNILEKNSMEVEILISNNLLDKNNTKVIEELDTNLTPKTDPQTSSWQFLKNLQQVKF